jgi:hypothetical protein
VKRLLFVAFLAVGCGTVDDPEGAAGQLCSMPNTCDVTPDTLVECHATTGNRAMQCSRACVICSKAGAAIPRCYLPKQPEPAWIGPWPAAGLQCVASCGECS